MAVDRSGFCVVALYVLLVKGMVAVFVGKFNSYIRLNRRFLYNLLDIYRFFLMEISGTRFAN